MAFNRISSAVSRYLPVVSQITARRCFAVDWKKHISDDFKRHRNNNEHSKPTLVGGTGGGSGVNGPQPYLQPKPSNIRYNPRMYQGGLLPRLDFDDEPVKLPEYQPNDKWAPHRAHFGQNDYIGKC